MSILRENTTDQCSRRRGNEEVNSKEVLLQTIYVPELREEVTTEELLKVISEYNKYIQEANEENKYVNGWYPVSIGEFYHNDME